VPAFRCTVVIPVDRRRSNQVGRNLAEIETVAGGDLPLQGETLGNRAIDAHMDDSEPVRTRDKTMGLDVRSS
jgi:hypothetical protein